MQVEVASYLAHENSYDINAWNAGKVLLWSRKRCRLLAIRISGIWYLGDIKPWYMKLSKVLLCVSKETYWLHLEVEILREMIVRLFGLNRMRNVSHVISLYL